MDGSSLLSLQTLNSPELRGRIPPNIPWLFSLRKLVFVENDKSSDIKLCNLISHGSAKSMQEFFTVQVDPQRLPNG